jgi:hypothetical protein
MLSSGEHCPMRQSALVLAKNHFALARRRRKDGIAAPGWLFQRQIAIHSGGDIDIADQ